MWTLQRFHQSISHAHVSVSIVRVCKSHKRKFMWKVHRRRIETQKQKKGEGTFAKITSRTRFISNSCQLILPSGNFWEQFFTRVRYGKAIEIVAIHVSRYLFFWHEGKVQCQVFFATYNLSMVLISSVCVWANFFELKTSQTVSWKFEFCFIKSQEGWERDTSTIFYLILWNENGNVVFEGVFFWFVMNEIFFA